MTYADVSFFASQKGSNARVSLVMHDQMRPVVIFPLWTLIENDLTLGNRGEQRVRSWVALARARGVCC
jgi:hypothetical protein